MSGILSMIAGGTYSSAPINTVAPVVSGTATVGQTLSTTNGTWTGAPTPTFTYQWQRAGSNIGSATSSTYVLVDADGGSAIRCVVTATNVVAAVSANSNATSAVAAIAPGAPTIGTATATSSTTATVEFTAPASNGGATITTYTATSSPSGITGTLSQSGSGTITVTGLAGATSYTFTVTATNSAGTSVASAASNSITTGLYRLFSWGSVGDGGALGLNNMTNYSSPKQVGSLINWKSISSDSEASSFGIKTDGTMWSWGRSNYGQLGHGNRTSYSSPKQIGALTNWSYVSAGNNNCYAIKTDGTLWTWGYGQDGNLGHNNLTNYSSPKQVGSLTTWATVHGGQDFGAAVDTSGRLFTWGRNASGGLGLGNTTYYSSPKQVGNLTNWQTLLVGNMSANLCLAVKTDGTLWAWGKNNNIGAGGLNNVNLYSSPKQVGALTNWLYIAGGRYNCAAIKTDGTMWRWGFNGAGQLGLGNTTNYSSPVQMGALTGWTNTAVGYAHWTGVRNGTLFTCGESSSGAMGLGNTSSYNSPKQVGSLSTWAKVANGQFHSLALIS
jgi:alpha-tubulin suppressor-like RCC1 family protein